jgi:hypothetical protein
MAGEVLQGNLDPDDWKAGFTPGSGGMWCNVCRALVRQSPGDAAAHKAWHEALDGS